MRARFLRGLILALSSLSLVAAFSLTNVPAASAGTITCSSTATARPTFHNLSVADGVSRTLDVHRRLLLSDGTYGNEIVDDTITEGTQRSMCVTADYVPLGRDIMLRCGNGYSVVQAGSGWHSLGGYCKDAAFGGKSFAVSFENRPNGYWG